MSHVLIFYIIFCRFGGAGFGSRDYRQHGSTRGGPQGGGGGRGGYSNGYGSQRKFAI